MRSNERGSREQKKRTVNLNSKLPSIVALVFFFFSLLFFCCCLCVHKTMNAAGCSQARTLHCPTSLSFQRTKKNLSAGTSSQLHSSCCARLSHAPVSLSLGKAPKERKEAVTLLLAGLKKSTSALFSVSESSQNDSRALSLPVFVVVSGSFFFSSFFEST